MFNKEGIKEFIKKLGIDEEDYILYAGGSLTMQGVKEETEDIDICVNENGLEFLKQRYDVRRSKKPYDNLYDVTDELEAKLIPGGLEKIEIVEVDGIKCTTLVHEYDWKKEKNREKDQEIIKKLEKILNK